MTDRRAYQKMWQERNRDKVRGYCKKWNEAHPQQRRDMNKRWRQTHRPQLLDLDKQWKTMHPLELKATNKARYVKREDKCEVCGSIEELEGHHPDYSELQIVVTVCKSCHVAIHQTLEQTSRTFLPTSF